MELVNFEASHCEMYHDWLKDKYILGMLMMRWVFWWSLMPCIVEMCDTDEMSLEDVILSQESYAEDEDSMFMLSERCDAV